MFDEKMAIGIGYRLLELAGGQLPHLKFMKLIYLVEREWMRFTGVTITGDRLKNMNDGPMLSGTYDCMKAGLPNKKNLWSRYLSQIDNKTVRIINTDESPNVLTRRQVKTVESIWEEFGGLEEEELIHFTHELPEWHFPNGRSVDIALEEVFADFGNDKEGTKELIARYRERDSLQKALGLVA